MAANTKAASKGRKAAAESRRVAASLLCATGFLKGVPLNGSEVGVPLSDLIRFMKEHGAWWFQLRAQKQLERLERIAHPERATVDREALAKAFEAVRGLKASTLTAA